MWMNLIYSYISEFIKSSEMSLDYCEKSRFAMEGGLIREAVQNFNLAMNYAVTSEDFMNVQICRSILLHGFQNNSGAVKEITSVLNSIQPGQRLEFCSKRDILGLNVKYQNLFNAELNSDQIFQEKYVEAKNKIKTFCDELFNLKSPNPLSPALESFVEIKYNEERGRHLIVTEDVLIGKYHILFKMNFMFKSSK